ncbi:serine hydrolase domain-containing protein [Amycolatopsis albispora]|uniref:Serine hydrolase n=1 Tax=Amycolatopsis albispora TaxID=1804986 RepID=A0A344KZW8_9PSEU|nr:serine hydrolase domain-containing protein [Amycolatopsis albispora]AXB41342.1 serine hydrolase [Amycolatopsis albispora]
MTGRGRRRLSAVVGAAVLAVAALTPAAHAQEHAATQEVLNRYQQKAGPGAAVHAGQGAGSWTLSAGSASVSEQRAIKPGDHFRIGSQTKTFTAAVVLQLFDEGLVELDAPIEKYLPGVVTGNYDGNVITVRQLLDHTAGLVRDPAGAKAEPDGHFTLAALVQAAMDDPPQGTPGGPHLYSNAGYLVLGMLVEKLTGQSIGDAITSRIITPLGLTGTSFPARGQRALASPFVPGYQGIRVGGFFFWYNATTLVELSSWSSAAAMESTMEDLVRFQRALAAGEVVSAKALAEMRTTVPLAPDPPMGYGLGLFSMGLSCGGEAWGHNGVLPTGHASITMVTDDGRFASVMTNTNFVTADPSSLDVVDTALCEGES